MKAFTPYTIKLRGKSITISEPWVMGILNVTPDSFYGNSRCNCEEGIVKRIHQIIDEGARIIDIGGYSSRSGATEVTPEEEYRRLEQGLSLIRREAPDAIVSVDTFRADIARRCVNEWGADIINDISGGNLDSAMFRTVGELGTPYILMHMRGTPKNMATLTHYDCVTCDVVKELSMKITELEQCGASNIIVDPGFGFSKTIQQNYELMNNLDKFHNLEKPLLVGISRKSMIYKPLNGTPESSLNGTTVLNTIALMQGAHILRVHDVKEAVEAVKITQYTRTQNLT